MYLVDPRISSDPHDPDYDRLGHSQFPSGLNQPPFSSAHSDDLGSVFGESEIDEFSGCSLSALSSEADTLLCRYLGDLYHGKKESSGADSLSGGRSSVHSDLFVNDASLANAPGIKLPPVFASEFVHLDSLGNFSHQNGLWIPWFFRGFVRSLLFNRRSTCLRPLSTFNFPSTVPAPGILRLGRWTHSPSGGQAFAFMPSHHFRFFPESWRRLFRKEQM